MCEEIDNRKCLLDTLSFRIKILPLLSHEPTKHSLYFLTEGRVNDQIRCPGGLSLEWLHDESGLGMCVWTIVWGQNRPKRAKSDQGLGTFRDVPQLKLTHKQLFIHFCQLFHFFPPITIKKRQKVILFYFLYIIIAALHKTISFIIFL